VVLLQIVIDIHDTVLDAVMLVVSVLGKVVRPVADKDDKPEVRSIWPQARPDVRLA
jgi:hypothetical protein